MKSPHALLLPKSLIDTSPVIRSLEENDLYKDTMRQVMLHLYPNASARYEFYCRNTPEYPLADLKADVERELDHLCGLTYSDEALEYKRKQRFMKSDYVDFLSIFRYQRRFISVYTEGEYLRIVAEGPQVHVMGFEIHTMNIVSELYFRRFEQEPLLAEGRKRLRAKIELLKEFREELKKSPRRHEYRLFDFGLRRRFSAAWQDEVVTTLAREVPDFFKGTSNVYLARKLGLTAIGTMAHEYLQSFQAYSGVRLDEFQKAAFEAWVQEYRGDLGIALTDVINNKACIADTDLYFGKLFEGVRHDSGNPYQWADEWLEHYQKLGLDSNTKSFNWSDGLDLPKSFDLYRTYADRVKTGFGIGTYFTNDMGIEPLNLIMKLVKCNGRPVAKLSDSPGKTLCKDEVFLANLRKTFNVTD